MCDTILPVPPHLQVEKLDPITGQWLPCCQTKTPEADVTGLQEGKKYKFRVKAVNKEGESEPLEADQFIVAKNPFGERLHSLGYTIETWVADDVSCIK